MLHALKTDPLYFAAIEAGNKTFDVRKSDRPFMSGDDIVLQEYIKEEEKYTGKEWYGKITYILDNPDYCKKGFVVLAITEKFKPAQPGNMSSLIK